MNKRTVAVGAIVLIVGGVGAWFLPAQDEPARSSQAGTTVRLPDLEGAAADGADLFATNCAVCHGENAAGTDQGPPFIHRIYEPNHHADMAFQLAVQNGVRAHHWRFGNMPPVEGMSQDDVEKTVAYVRALQRANGIE